MSSFQLCTKIFILWPKAQEYNLIEYFMLSAGKTWNPLDLFNVDMPELLKEQQRTKAIKQVIHFLETKGLKLVSLLVFEAELIDFGEYITTGHI